MAKITAFVARSFAAQDEHKIQPILRHLDSFHDLGFVWESAEPAEAERVSAKVCRIIAGCDVFVGILTKKYPIYDVAVYPGGILKAFGRKPKPDRWSPPGWVIQESGYALGLGKKIILFVEPELDLPFLQGDLEYVPYDHTKPAVAFTKASEMINKLIAASTGIAVETVVRAEPPEPDKPKEAPQEPQPSAETKEQVPVEPNLRDLIAMLFDATEKLDWEKADNIYKAGLEFSETTTARIGWECFCLRVRYCAGDATALDKLKAVEQANPNEPAPSSHLGLALLTFKEYDAAAAYFERAAALSQGSTASFHLLRAADALTAAKNNARAKRILVKLLDADDSSRLEAGQKLYDLLTSSGKHFASFGIAELTLHRNPGLNALRFSLGLHYHEEGLNELFLYHYKLLNDLEPERADVFHNLAIAYFECDLQVRCVASYKQAIGLGETLAASNLGHKYLNTGMADEARTLLLDALKKPECAPEVGSCLAAIGEREKRERESEKSLVEAADGQRKFLVALGEGLYREGLPTIEGLWRMPFGEIVLTHKGNALTGVAETGESVAPRALLGILGGVGTYPGRYEFTGVMEGSVCKFKLTSMPKVSGSVSGALATKRSEGYMVFSVNGDSAMYTEIEGKKLTKYRTVERVLGPVPALPNAL
jgi:tetratricopeptide (TPR) repeat protein